MNKNSLTYQNDNDIYRRDMVKGKKGTADHGDGVQVLVRISEELDAILADDAKLNKRSKKGHVEAILEAYYEMYSGDIRDMVDIRSRLSPNYVKTEIPRGKKAVEKARHNNPGLTVAPPKRMLDHMEQVDELRRISGEHVPIDALSLYCLYLKDGDRRFFEKKYPTRIKELVIAYKEGRLEEYLSENQAPEEKTAG